MNDQIFQTVTFKFKVNLTCCNLNLLKSNLTCTAEVMNINEDKPQVHPAQRKNFGTELLKKIIVKSDGTIILLKNISYTTGREVPQIVLTKVSKAS